MSNLLQQAVSVFSLCPLGIFRSMMFLLIVLTDLATVGASDSAANVDSKTLISRPSSISDKVDEDIRSVECMSVSWVTPKVLSYTDSGGILRVDKLRYKNEVTKIKRDPTQVPNMDPENV